MGVRKVLAALLVAAVSCAACATSLEYTVTVPASGSTLHVKVVAEDLRDWAVTLTLRSEARYVESFISNLTSSAGTPSRVGEAQWSIRSTGRQLTYEYDIAKVVPWRPNVPWGRSSDIAVYFDESCGVVMAPYLFMFPDREEFSSIRLRFVTPPGWRIVTPYPLEGDVYSAQKVTRSLISDFLSRQQIYMGKMLFYAETDLDGCLVTFGKLACDENIWEAVSQREVEEYAEATARSVRAMTELFGSNPYRVFAMYTNFQRHGHKFQGTRYAGNGYQYWPQGRWDELVGHVAAAWALSWDGPLRISYVIRGMIENYYGPLTAWDLFRDPLYLAKFYLWYLMYEWMYYHHDRGVGSYTGGDDEYDADFRWPFIGLLLDKEIQRRTEGQKSLADAIRWLYERYANSGHTITVQDIQHAILASAAVSLDDTFGRYIYGQQRLPVGQYLEPYREHFQNYVTDFMRLFHQTDVYCGFTVPFFIQVVLAGSLAEHLQWGLLGEDYPAQFAREVLKDRSPQDISEQDVVDTLSRMTGEDCSDFFTHWQGSYGRLSLAEIRDWLASFTSGKAVGSPSGGEYGVRIGSEADGTMTATGPLTARGRVTLKFTVQNPIYLGATGQPNTVRFAVRFVRGAAAEGTAIEGYKAYEKRLWSGPNGDTFEEVAVPVAPCGGIWCGEVVITVTEGIHSVVVIGPRVENTVAFGLSVK